MTLKRRDFITLLGGAAAAWRMTARAQQPAIPVIGWLSGATSDSEANLLPSFREALKAEGFVEGRTLAIEFRWTEGRTDRLPEMAADLVRRRVSVIVVSGSVIAALAAKAATMTIPIVFQTAADPVSSGLVASLNRPGGNLTGVTSLNVEIGPKRLELLHEIVPAASVLALLVNPNSPSADTYSKDARAAALSLGFALHVLRADTEREIEKAFTTLAELHAGGLVIAPDPLFNSRREALAALTVRHAVPAIYQSRAFVAAGGLLGYGDNIADEYRLLGTYTARILKGEKPADLPVQQATKVELTINMRTAKALGITVPITLLGRADEVIE
jgi:putative tryptophan/tyrosine transport system substrate-binding protein